VCEGYKYKWFDDVVNGCYWRQVRDQILNKNGAVKAWKESKGAQQMIQADDERLLKRVRQWCADENLVLEVHNDQDETWATVKGMTRGFTGKGIAGTAAICNFARRNAGALIEIDRRRSVEVPDWEATPEAADAKPPGDVVFDTPQFPSDAGDTVLEICFQDGDSAFVCGGHGIITGEMINAIEADVAEDNEGFVRGDGIYLCRVHWQEPQFGVDGRLELKGYWDLDIIGFKTLEQAGADRAAKRGADNPLLGRIEDTPDYTPRNETEQAIVDECDDLARFLIGKNRKYGNSALDPVRIFSKADAREQLLVRIDDKLSRFKRGDDAGEDTVLDLLGYLVLLRVWDGLEKEP